MGVNLKNMKRMHNEYNRKSEFWNIKDGDNVVYIHPPCREDDKDPVTSGSPYLRCRVHYGVGPNKNMVVCMDTNRNPILNHPFVRKVLADRDIKLSGSCPVCQECESDTIDSELAQNMRGQYKSLWGVTPIRHREDSTDDYQTLDQLKPTVMFVGKTVYDGLMELFFENGDITNPQSTMFARITRSGKGFTTKYHVFPDVPSLKKPKQLPENFVKKMTDALASKCNLFEVLANMVRSENEVTAMFVGVQLAEEEEDDLDTVDDGWGESDGTEDWADTTVHKAPPTAEEDEDAAALDMLEKQLEENVL